MLCSVLSIKAQSSVQVDENYLYVWFVSLQGSSGPQRITDFIVIWTELVELVEVSPLDRGVGLIFTSSHNKGHELLPISSLLCAAADVRDEH